MPESQYAPFDKYFLQTRVDESGHQGAVVSAHGLYAFTVHLIVLFRLCPVQARVALLVDEQVREVNLGRHSKRVQTFRTKMADKNCSARVTNPALTLSRN